MVERGNKKLIFTIIFYALAIGYCFITIGPFIWSIITSLKPADKVGTLSLSGLTFSNYTYVISKFPFGTWTLNSIIRSGLITAGKLIINSMAGYALARLEFPGKKIVFLWILGMMMIPNQVTLVPTFILLSKLNLVNTYPGLVIPFLYDCFGIFLMRQFFLSLPKSLEEAALIDGMGRFGIFWKIALPLAKPALTTQFIIMFTGSWNDFMWPSLLAASDKMYTLPVGLNSFYNQYNATWNHVTAGVMILTVPTLLIFMIFQRNFIKGIATAGLKD